jgi:hypothetical protein
MSSPVALTNAPVRTRPEEGDRSYGLCWVRLARALRRCGPAAALGPSAQSPAAALRDSNLQRPAIVIRVCGKPRPKRLTATNATGCEFRYLMRAPGGR